MYGQGNMQSYAQSLLQDFEKYQSDYKKFSYCLSCSNAANKVIDFDYSSRVLVFDSTALSETDRIFLVSPSIFNSPDILLISSPDDLITNLRMFGKVYMVEWKEVTRQDHTLDNYAISLSKILLQIQQHHNKNIDIIGHCIGGNIAIAANILAKHQANSITLLSTPWDFSFLKAPKKIYDELDLEKTIESIETVPALYFQILFFLMNPSSFEQKIGYYKHKASNMNIEKFFAVERWQSSGIDLPKALYKQLMNSFIDKNIMLNNEWKIDGVTIDPSLINSPTLLIIGTKDNIVPPESSNALPILKPHITKFSYDTGHIGYLVGSQKKKFILELNSWIKNMESKYERSLHYAC